MSVVNGNVHFSAASADPSAITVKSSGVQFLPGKAVNGSITDGPDADHWAVTASFQFDSSGFKSFVFNADQLTINLGDFLHAEGLELPDQHRRRPERPARQLRLGRARPSASPASRSQARRRASRSSATARSAPGPASASRSRVGSADGSSFQWPSWLPIHIDAIGIQWPNINTDPTNFVLTLSASVTGIEGIAGLDVLRLDPGHPDRRREAARTASSRSSASPRSASRSRATCSAASSTRS